MRYGLAPEDYIIPILARVPQPIVFELGARRGEDTVRLARALRTPYRYFAWEPDPRNVPWLEQAVAPLPAVTIVRAAAGADDGTADFHLSSREQDPDYSDSSSLLRPTPALRRIAPGLVFNETVTVTVRTLDNFCVEQSVDHIDLIWADVEGAERLVAAGARRMLPRTSLLMLEQSPEKLYEGAWTFDEMRSTLGSEWIIVKRFDNDVLLYNRACMTPPNDADWVRFVRGCLRDLA
ncbi:MAG TPA: FkbM family methyltransferase [Vicinamibacterales bacterium]|nr:FkbM family methyltransferase [Vicinamibacterales bacterium]